MDASDETDIPEGGEEQAELGSEYSRACRFLDGVVDASDSPLGVELLKAAAARGDPRAQYDLAQLYLEGEGVPQSLAHASELLFDAARKGIVSAHVDLAAIHLYRPSSWHPYSAVYPHLAQAAGLGDHLAALEIGKLELLAGQAKRGVEWLNIAAEGRVAAAKRWLAMASWFGFGLPTDTDRAMDLTLEAANAGDIGASYQHVWMGGPWGEVPDAGGEGSVAEHLCCEAIFPESFVELDADLGVELDPPLARAIRHMCGARAHWMLRAVAADYPPALAWVGERMSPSVVSLDVDESLQDSERDGIDLLTEAAVKWAHPRAAWLLGRWYASKENGLGEAVRMLKIATRSNYADSRTLVLDLFEKPGAETSDVTRDFAEAGIAYAQFEHAMSLYASGDSRRAFQWMRRAALGGHKGASRRLAFFYEMGEGCQKDQVLAAGWRDVSEGGASLPEQGVALEPPHFDVSLWRSRVSTHLASERVSATVLLKGSVAGERDAQVIPTTLRGERDSSQTPDPDAKPEVAGPSSYILTTPPKTDGVFELPISEISESMDRSTCWLDAWRLIGPAERTEAPITRQPETSSHGSDGSELRS